MEIDFGLIALFMRASLVVQIVMVLLVLASIWAWSIVIAKWKVYRDARKANDEFTQEFWSGGQLNELYQSVGNAPDADMERVFVAGMKEWRKNLQGEGRALEHADMRIDRAMNVAINHSRENWEKGLGALASIGSTAPFIGLFGTVWGIKNAFQDIAVNESSNLAIVAPGVAEALLATAFGLFAAIPAVIFYNKYSADVDGLNNDLENFADEFSVILSRQIDQERS